MKPIAELPDDPALPAMAMIRSHGLPATVPALDLGEGPVELLLRGYTPGERATLEAHVGDRRFAVKAYAKDPSKEAALYQALAEAGLTSGSGARVPRLLALNRDLCVLVISWLVGEPINQLVRDGRGRRAGTLAAAYLRRAASLPADLGPTFDSGEVLFEVGRRVARMVVSDSFLGHSADKVANRLLSAPPNDGDRHLVHGALYSRHILDLGDGPGVIDWQRFGRGPLELDAGTFLATVSKIAVRHERLAGEVARAEEAFREGTRDLLDERSLAWHRAVTLLRLAAKPFRSIEAERGLPRDERKLTVAEARALVGKAALQAEAIG